MNNTKSKIRYSIFPKVTGGIIHFLAAIVIFLLVSIISITYTLTTYSNDVKDKLNDISTGNKRYTMVDNFYDADSFYEFRQNKDNINILANFYNEFFSSKKVTMLSVFDQALHLKGFKGNKKFLYNSEEFVNVNRSSDIGVKSIQLNKKAFDFYDLKLEDDYEINWKYIDYKNNSKVPIILGSDYKGIYKLGNIISGNLYGKQFEFEVVGFLKENSYIYYKNSPEFYLDRYIIIPYPVKLWKVDKEDFSFEGILYFAMINSDLVTNINHNLFIEEVKRISKETYFKDFSIVNIDDFLIKYTSLISVIKENTTLLYALMGILYTISMFALYGIFIVATEYKIPNYRLLWIIGYEKYKAEIFIKLIAALILSVITAIIIPKVYFGKIFLSNVFFLFLAEVLSFYFIYRLLLRYVEKKIGGA